jgi:hypothetical protein
MSKLEVNVVERGYSPKPKRLKQRPEQQGEGSPTESPYPFTESPGAYLGRRHLAQRRALRSSRSL